MDREKLRAERRERKKLKKQHRRMQKVRILWRKLCGVRYLENNPRVLESKNFCTLCCFVCYAFVIPRKKMKVVAVKREWFTLAIFLTASLNKKCVGSFRSLAL